MTHQGCLILLLLLGCTAGPDRAAEEIDPQAASFMARMQAAYQQENLPAALALADSADRYAPALPDVHYTRGEIFIRLRRYEEAQAAFSSVLAEKPDYPGAAYRLGHTAFLQRQYRKALGYYRQEKALVADARRRTVPEALDPKALPTITAQIGRTYEMLGVADSARAAYEEALRGDSTLAVAHAWLSELYENQGQLEQALHHAHRALQENPAEVEYGYRVGALLFQTGQIEAAVPFLAAVVQRWPGHEGATYNLGRALKALGRDEEGQAHLDRVETLLQLQEEALLAERGVETYPQDPARWITLAGLMVQIGYYDKAEEAFRVAFLLKPDDLSLQNDLANLAFARGDTTLALRRFQTLLRQDSTFADAWLNLGIIYALTGRPGAARKAWQQTLRLNPGDPQAKAYLAQLE